MKNYDQFHDGFLEGILIEDTTVYVQLSTDQKERFSAVLTGVVALTVNGLKAGNVVFEVQTREAPELTVQDVEQLYDLVEGSAGQNQAQRLLKQAQEKTLMLFEIVPSYGATCLVLARSVEIVDREKWLKSYSRSVVSNTP